MNPIKETNNTMNALLLQVAGMILKMNFDGNTNDSPQLYRNDQRRLSRQATTGIINVSIEVAYHCRHDIGSKIRDNHYAYEISPCYFAANLFRTGGRRMLPICEAEN